MARILCSIFLLALATTTVAQLAMRPPRPEDKLALLQQLGDSGDPVLQKEAENAIKAVKAKMAPR